MPPEDPLGRDGPTLDQFLRKKKHIEQLGDGYVPKYMKNSDTPKIALIILNFELCGFTLQE